MADVDMEDSLTRLNTQLNKSMVLMDNSIENETHQPKSNKSIRINTKTQPATPNSSTTSRKSILKKTNEKTPEKRHSIEARIVENNTNTLNHRNHDETSKKTTANSRPRNIDELIQTEDLILESTESTFNLDDISDNEDIWLMDIPKTIDPEELIGQTLVFGEKSKLKIKEERYCAVNHDVKYNITCVFKTGKVKSKYEAVNVKPAGAFTVRRKLSGISKTEPMEIEDTSVPFPKTLKTRHPLLGVSYEGKVKKCAIK